MKTLFEGITNIVIYETEAELIWAAMGDWYIADYYGWSWAEIREITGVN